VTSRVDRPLDVDRLVEHMFDQVLDDHERAELLVWIKRWEVANPDADAAHRVTGWIDVAYAFQARNRGALPILSRDRAWTSGRWAFA
jgi:hypothetical protein